jgi:hypothetical protein
MDRPRPTGSPGHVFVTRGDLTRLACDAWLLPTDDALTVEAPWSPHLPAFPRPAGWGDAVLTAPAFSDGRGPWPTSVGTTRPDLDHIARAVQVFIESAAAALDGRPPRNNRTRHLLAVPMVGTGQGGAADVRGDVARRLLGVLSAGAAKTGVDLTLVTYTKHAYAAAQTVRRRAGEAAWNSLPDALRMTADRLGQEALDGNLVLFLGAGLGYAAGLPGWAGLLAYLADIAGMSDGERAALAELDVLDQARIVRDRLGGQTELGASIAMKLAGDPQGLGHQLLASLGVREVVTTNYDTRFEQAARDAGRRLAVLPYEPARSVDGWLLKMHGCVNHPEDIVLTRDDYLGYAERRGALAGIVQALLITRHMLFVGFSLTDPNFHKVLHEVRSALRSRTTDATPLGSALVLGDAPLLGELWGRDIAVEPIVAATIDEGARLQEILLDRAAMAASDTASHLLDPAYTGLLDDADAALADSVSRFAHGLPAEADEATGWRPVAQMLAALGSRAPIEACFARRFRRWGLSLPPEACTPRSDGRLVAHGWVVRWRWRTDGSLQVFAKHRTTDPSWVIIAPDGRESVVSVPVSGGDGDTATEYGREFLEAVAEAGLTPDHGRYPPKLEPFTEFAYRLDGESTWRVAPMRPDADPSGELAE